MSDALVMMTMAALGTTAQVYSTSTSALVSKPSSTTPSTVTVLLLPCVYASSCSNATRAV
jgi:hypothetical protein